MRKGIHQFLTTNFQTHKNNVMTNKTRIIATGKHAIAVRDIDLNDTNTYSQICDALIAVPEITDEQFKHIMQLVINYGSERFNDAAKYITTDVAPSQLGGEIRDTPRQSQFKSVEGC